MQLSFFIGPQQVIEPVGKPLRKVNIYGIVYLSDVTVDPLSKIHMFFYSVCQQRLQALNQDALLGVLHKVHIDYRPSFNI